ncbi:uracil-DNA glycosylase [candidate division KSB1 bacterium]|nr:uracil-DNA glycosylase [candidate division KSB1 bacterium]RQW01399.1 MAG: uracil-DNA glycosylase [candidate division KSB1 bacterium]
MNDFRENFTAFLQQQLELYGDDAICEASSLRKEPFAEKDASPAAGAATLAELHQSIEDCQRCALGRTRTRLVFGSGKPQAEIVLVGEAPGAEEDRAGVPFVGRAGALLTKILASVQIKREDVYICNILKCRPPQNRDPLPEEIALCKPYLFAQLQLIRPKIIVCLGRVAAQVLLETTDSLSKLRGQWHGWNGIDVMVTYHPAALLRNPGYKRETWEDMKGLQQRRHSTLKR